MLFATTLITMICTGTYDNWDQPQPIQIDRMAIIIDMDNQTVRVDGVFYFGCAKGCHATITDTAVTFAGDGRVGGTLDRYTGQMVGFDNNNGRTGSWHLTCKPSKQLF